MYWNDNKARYIWNVSRLTLTWDVLKSRECGFKSALLFWLTLTWDVLKWKNGGYIAGQETRLTLTWDVLKCNRKNFFYNESKININMRCIEMHTK